MCKTNKSKFLAGWIKGIILGPQLLSSPCEFSVSPSPFGLHFGTLDLRTLDSGLTIVWDVK